MTGTQKIKNKNEKTNEKIEFFFWLELRGPRHRRFGLPALAKRRVKPYRARERLTQTLKGSVDIGSKAITSDEV